MPRWFYKRDGQEYGPLTELGMRELLARGRLSPGSDVRRYDDSDPDLEHPWQILAESQLAQTLSAEPETAPIIQIPPPMEENNRSMPLLAKLTTVLASGLFLLLAAHSLMKVPLKLQAASAGIYHDGPLVGAGEFVLWMDGLGPILLGLYLFFVILWQASAADVPPLFGAEVVTYPPSSALLWLLPGLNFYHCREAAKELWSLSRDPKAWSRGGIRSTPVISLWWLTLLGSALFALALAMIRRNLGSSLRDGRMDHWQGTLSLISGCRDLMWACHLLLFLIFIWQVMGLQKHSLANPLRKKVRRD
jgi:hypothetical protein